MIFSLFDLICMIQNEENIQKKQKNKKIKDDLFEAKNPKNSLFAFNIHVFDYISMNI